MDVKVGKSGLEGFLEIPEGAKAIILFVHGAGSSRHSPRNQYVATVFQKAGLGTLLMDLLTPEEDTREARFDIDLLVDRITDAIDWLAEKKLKIGLIGSSTGAAAALIAATMRPIEVIVSRGGRPDLAGEALPFVKAPTLLIVGGNDFQVIELNEQAFERLTCDKELTIIPGATHLFDEAGTLEAAADQACAYFVDHVSP